MQYRRHMARSASRSRQQIRVVARPGRGVSRPSSPRSRVSRPGSPRLRGVEARLAQIARCRGQIAGVEGPDPLPVLPRTRPLTRRLRPGRQHRPRRRRPDRVRSAPALRDPIRPPTGAVGRALGRSRRTANAIRRLAPPTTERLASRLTVATQCHRTRTPQSSRPRATA